MLDLIALTENIKAEAHHLGFVLAGVTTPDSPDHLSTYSTWIQNSRHASMGYLATERARQLRQDPRLILPGVRSILCLGMPYHPSNTFEGEGTSPGDGRIAAYAWGKDYHTVIPPRLEKLAERIQILVNHPVAWKAYTDTGPVLERDLAMRAGIGWIGKNTCLIHPRHGSYFFLAELFLDIELMVDPPFRTDYCGSCTRCIQACPTGCILPDRTLEAGRCISYLTIENKGPIDQNLREKMGDWVFGCDICQQVCPWNIRFAGPGPDPELDAAPEHVPLEEHMAYDSPRYNRRFTESPVHRSRRRGYLRNVAVVLGNQRRPESVSILWKALMQDPEVLIRAHAAWALGKIGSPEALNGLQLARISEANPEVLAEIDEALQSSSK